MGDVGPLFGRLPHLPQNRSAIVIDITFHRELACRHA